jgi:membrane protein YdbS with pleckstrin-like domain
MYCNRCGQALPAGSRFCNHCGAAVAAEATPANKPEQAGRYAVRPEQAAAHDTGMGEASEQVIFILRPTLFFVVVRYLIAAAVMVTTAAIMGLLHGRWPEVVTNEVAFIVVLVVALLAFSVPVYRHILRRREVYKLTNHKLEMRYGLLSKMVRNIPLRNIQDVTVTATAWERLLNMGSIIIDSASETGKIKLSDIHHPERYADMILEELRRRY